MDGWVAWGVVPESSAGATTAHYSFLRCGWWAREAGGGEGEMGGDQTSVGATKGG